MFDPMSIALMKKLGGSGGGAGAFVVTFTCDEEGNLSADKTLDELAQAYISGVKVEAVLNQLPAVDSSCIIEFDHLSLMRGYVYKDGSKGFVFSCSNGLYDGALVCRTIDYSNGYDDGSPSINDIVVELHPTT